MKKYLLYVALLFTGCVQSAGAALSVTPGTPAHTHADANTGGATLNVGNTLTVAGATALNSTLDVINRTNLGGPLSVSSTITLSGALSSTKACAAGYTRLTPNYCRANAPAGTALTPVTGSCLSVSAPAGALAVEVFLAAYEQPANSVGFRQMFIAAYSDAACVTQIAQISAAFYEFTAINSTSTIAENDVVLLVPVVGGAFYLTALQSVAGNGVSKVLGYYD